MSNVITLLRNPLTDIWSNEERYPELKRSLCPYPLTDTEFNLALQIGRATGLNPFLREMWIVKYSDKSPAQIFIGRDGYRKGAQQHPDYEYHQVNAIYSNDEFRISNDEIQHNYGFSNRGELMGAYCIVKRKSASRPTYVMVTMEEYHQSQGVWKTKPETMIKKVAEAQALRQSFQESFGGTYSDAELPQEKQSSPVKLLKGNTQTEKLKSLLNTKDRVDELKTKQLYELIATVGLPEERMEKALAHYEVSNLDELSYHQKESFINNLKKISEQQLQ